MDSDASLVLFRGVRGLRGVMGAPRERGLYWVIGEAVGARLLGEGGKGAFDGSGVEFRSWGEAAALLVWGPGDEFRPRGGMDTPMRPPAPGEGARTREEERGVT